MTQRADEAAVDLGCEQQGRRTALNRIPAEVEPRVSAEVATLDVRAFANADGDECAILTRVFPDLPCVWIPGPMATNDGGTATRKGLMNALAELEGAPEYAPRAVVLITDGTALCAPEAQTGDEAFEVYDQGVHTLVADAFMQGIPTHVIGIEIENVTYPNKANDGLPNGINNYQKLNELAVDGGRPVSGGTNFHHCNNEDELKSAVQEALEDAKSCNIVLPEVPTQPGNTAVEVGGVTYSYTEDLDCDEGDGWIYLDDTDGAIGLCGSACNALKSEGTATVTIGC